MALELQKRYEHVPPKQTWQEISKRWSSFAYLRTALDFDSVLADAMIPFTDVVSKRKGIRASKSDIFSWGLEDKFGITSSEVNEILDFIWSDAKWREVPPTEDCLSWKVRRLMLYGRVDIVTVIPENLVPNSKRWLEYHRIPYQDYVRVLDGMKKSDLDYNVFIDDSGLTAEQLKGSDKIMLLYDQPWNRDVNAIRIHSLDEAVEYLIQAKNPLRQIQISNNSFNQNSFFFHPVSL